MTVDLNKGVGLFRPWESKNPNGLEKKIFTPLKVVGLAVINSTNTQTAVANVGLCFVDPNGVRQWTFVTDDDDRPASQSRVEIFAQAGQEIIGFRARESSG